MQAPHTPQATVRVWDRFVRVFHWSLVGSFFTAWWFTEHIGWLHKGAGYLATACVVARVVWGFIGPGHARFASFVPGPRKLRLYLAAVARGREPRHLGHNPAGSVMVLFLLAAVITLGVSGHLMTLDAFWGNETVENVHLLAVDITLLAVALHVAANFYASWHHRENLVAAMVTGRKRAATEPVPGGASAADVHPAIEPAVNRPHPNVAATAAAKALATAAAPAEATAPSGRVSRSGSAAYRG